MKLVIFLVLAVVAVARAKIWMSRHVLAAMEKNNIDDEPLVQSAVVKETLYIPMARQVSCDDSGCDSTCKALGYRHGVCVSATTCECYS